MQLLGRTGLLVAALLTIVLSGCVSAPSPAVPSPTVASREALVVLPALLAEPQRWSGQRVVLIAPVKNDPGGHVLTIPPDSSVAVSGAGVWLAQPLPESIIEQVKIDTAVLRLRGTLSPPGAYGRDQQFSYQFSADDIALLQPERTTLVNLVENPRALDRILLRLEGTLLVERDSALLVDQVSAGGVPLGTGRQIKLPRAAINDETIGQLNRSGEVRWGLVQVVGWWQDSTLTLFSISPTTSATPSGG